MTRKVARSLIGLGILGLVLVAFGTWRAWQPGADGTSQETRAGHPALELVAPAFAAGNAPPTANAGLDRTVSAGQTVVLDGGGSTEPEGKAMDFLWSLTSVPVGSLAALDDATAVRPNFVADVAGDYIIELVVSEGPRDSAPDTVVISTTNSAPVADAGVDQAVTLGQTLRLDASASHDFDGDALSYAWTLTSRPAGSAATLDDLTAVQPSFVVDVAGDYMAELTVDDGTATSAVAAVTVSTGNVAPVADAGLDQRAVVGQVIRLDASRVSDAEGDELAIDWSLVRRPEGSSAKLSKPSEDRPSLTVDVPGIYIVQLDTTDGPTDSAPATIVTTTGNTAPVADAGSDQAIAAGELVTLDGGGSSDIDGDALIYRWALLSFPAGSAAALDDPTAVRPSFTADLAGTYVAQLVVDDGARPGRPDTVVLSNVNIAPVADAGPDQTVAAGSLAQLDGGASFDADLDALSFQWSILVTPNGSMAALDDPSALNPSLTVDKNGVYIVQLLVSDGQGESAPDGIVVSTSNSRPVAEAGPEQQVVRGVVVQLDGSASSDPDNDPLNHLWALLSKPAGSTAVLSDPAAVSPTFTADIIGSYVAQLIVSEGTLDSEPDTVVIETVNSPPVADAGPDQAVTAGDLVTLDGSASFDPENDPISFAWSLVSKPADSLAALSNSSVVSPTFSPDTPGTYVAELVVSDALAPSAPDQVTVTAAPATGVNFAPVLAAIGDQSVDLGATLTLDLAATDLNGDALAFSASPLPLPAGASLDGITGEFSFTPDETQVGDIALTFIVSDGLASDSEAITITVVGAPMGGTTALSGRLLDSNDAALGVTTPIEGATVALLGVAGSTMSDSNGDFLLSGVPSGDHVLDIDSSTAIIPPSVPPGTIYASFREELTLIADVTNVIDRPVFLPRIDPAGTVFIDATSTTTTTVDNAPLGVSLEVPPDTAFEEDGVTEFEGDLSISEVPVAFAPMALPEEFQPAMLISIQPTGVTFNQPLAITFPNTDNLAPGSEVDIYSLDAASGTFVIVGVGTVSTDGTVIETTSGGIVEATWHYTLGPMPSGDASANNGENKDPNKCVECNTGSGTHVNSGNLAEAHVLASYRSLNQARSLRFVYNSTSADPRPVIVTDTTIPFRSALPNTISTRLVVAGVDQGEVLHTATSGLSESVDETIRQAAQFDAAGFATGSYPYSLSITNHFDASAVSAIQTGRVLVRNERASPFGAGWTLAGLERLHEQVDGRAVLTKGDGSTLTFDPSLGEGESFGLSATIEDIRRTNAFAVDDLDGDGNLDVAVPDGLTGNLFVLLGDGQGQFPIIRQFPSGNPFTSGPDPISAATGDFNNDGLRDITVANQNTDKVTVHLGTGGGFFAQAPTLFPGILPLIVGVADFNLDGKDDIFVGKFQDPARIYDGNGDGTFAAPRDVSPGFQQISLAIDDLNGDLAPDLVVAITGPDLLSLLINDGFGNFSVSTITAGPLGAFPDRLLVATGDFNGDGVVDIVNTNEEMDTVSVHLADGLGGYLPRMIIPVGARPTSVDVADFDQDGALDVAVVNQIEGTVNILLGDGSGGFTVVPAGTFTAPPMRNLRAGDFNNDGLPDIATGRNDNVSGAFFLLLNQSTGGITLQSPAGDFSTLVRNTDGSFTRTLKNGTTIEYDADGFMTARVDRNGNATAYAYDAGDNLTTITDPVGLVTTLAYTGGLLTSVTDPAGRVTGLAHDGAGDLVSITDPDLSVRQFAYDGDHRLTSQTSKRNFVTSYDYGFHGRNTRADRPDGSFVLTAPSEVVGLIDAGAGLGTPSNPAPFLRPAEVVATFTDGNGNTTTYETDKFGSATRVLDPEGRVLITERDAAGLPTRLIAPNGRVTDIAYDSKGNPTTTTEAVGDPLARTISITYDSVSNKPNTVTNSAGTTVTVEYDIFGNAVSLTDTLLRMEALSYNDLNCPGLPTNVTRAVGLPEQSVFTLVYDPATCHATQVTDPEGASTNILYDASGNVAQITDPNFRITRITYDSLNRVTRISDPTTINDPNPLCGTSGVTCYIYDANGNRTEVVDGNSNITTFVYDERDRVTERIDPLSASEQTLYDGEGNVVRTVDRKGQVNEFAYDAINRLISSTILPGEPGEIIRQFVYDANSNLAAITDPDSTLSFTYDLLDRVNNVSTVGSPFQPGVTLDYSYDPNGNRVAMIDSPKGTTSYVYDELSRLKQIVNPDLDQIDFEYDSRNRRVLTQFANTVETTVLYDKADRLTDLTHSLGPTTLSSFALTLDGVGNRLQIDQVRSSLVLSPALTFLYDDRDQVIQATNQLAGLPDETFNYDPIGNRLRRDGEVVDSIFDAANRLLEDGQFCYAYDLNGNQTSKTAKVAGTCIGGVTTYSYDPENRLTRIDFPDFTFAAYRYDGLGRRIEKDVNGAIMRYVYDEEDILYEFDGSGIILARYTHGLGIDEPLIMQRDLDDSEIFDADERFFYHSDALGSIVQLTDANGVISRAYAYDAFGQIAAENGSLINPYTYTGREFDTESSLYFYRARYYDPNTGRFLQQDPLGFAADFNPYRYVFNNPVRFTDPTGLVTNWDCYSGLMVSLGIFCFLPAAPCAALPPPYNIACTGAVVGSCLLTLHFVVKQICDCDLNTCEGDVCRPFPQCQTACAGDNAG